MASRFSQLIKADTNYIPIDKNLGQALSFKYGVMKDEEGRVDKAIEANALAKQRYSEILSKLHPSDYKYAQQMMDDYTKRNAEAVVSANGNPFMTQAVQQASEFVGRPEFQRMLQKGEHFRNQTEVSNKLSAAGKVNDIYNPDAMNKALYDEQGQLQNTDYQKFKTNEILNYNEEMAKFFKDVNPDQFKTSLSPDVYGWLRDRKVLSLSPEKLEKIAKELFPLYQQSNAGRSQYNDLTTASINKPETIDSPGALQKMLNDFVQTARSQRGITQAQSDLVQDWQQKEAYSRAAKAKEEGVDIKPSGIIPEDNITLHDKDLVSEDTGGIATSKISTLTPDQKVHETLTLDNVTVPRSSFSNSRLGTPESQVTLKNAVQQQPKQLYTFVRQEELRKENGGFRFVEDAGKTKSFKNEIVFTGGLSNTDLSLKTHDKPIRDKDTGELFFQEGDKKIIVQPLAYKHFVDQDGMSAYQRFTDVLQEAAMFGGEYTGRRVIDVNKNGSINSRYDDNTTQTLLVKGAAQLGYNPEQIIKIYNSLGSVPASEKPKYLKVLQDVSDEGVRVVSRDRIGGVKPEKTRTSAEENAAVGE